VTLVIRLAAPTDAPVIAEFNRRLAVETEDKVLDPAILAVGVAAILADAAKGRYFVAEESGEVLGQISVTYEWSDWRNGWWWWIQSVYVRADARRRGVFRALYEHVREVARRDRTVIGLRLYAERENYPAHRTYEDMGMEQIPFVLYQRWPL
jgi:GNAT superfamily N-acetyltransferase